MEEAILNELTQMESLDVYEPVHRENVTTKIITSKMILKEKIDSNGNFIKFKARLVAGGHLQIADENIQTSSPTASNTSLMILSYIASKENREIATADVTAAYLNAKMVNDVFMVLNKNISKTLLEHFPEKYKNFLSEDGTIIVKLKKTMKFQVIYSH
jgi:hypothetical protein